MSDLSIIIISYNTADLIGMCIKSIGSSQGCNYEIIVVDNASTDKNLQLIKENYPSVHLIENRENRGFGAANNQAIKLCKSRYILFLNPDTEIKSDTLTNMVTYMDNNPAIGLAGARIVNPDGSLQESISYRYPGQKYTRGELGHLKGPIACVLGAGMIGRTDLIKSIGGFDESFFLYGEDEDLCLTIRKADQIGYIDQACIVHIGGQSNAAMSLMTNGEKNPRRS